jgi:hypothetical protein
LGRGFEPRPPYTMKHQVSPNVDLRTPSEACPPIGPQSANSPHALSQQHRPSDPRRRPRHRRTVRRRRLGVFAADACMSMLCTVFTLAAAWTSRRAAAWRRSRGAGPSSANRFLRAACACVEAWPWRGFGWWPESVRAADWSRRGRRRTWWRPWPDNRRHASLYACFIGTSCPPT